MGGAPRLRHLTTATLERLSLSCEGLNSPTQSPLKKSGVSRSTSASRYPKSSSNFATIPASQVGNRRPLSSARRKGTTRHRPRCLQSTGICGRGWQSHSGSGCLGQHENARHLPVGDDPDVLSFDPGLKQLYVSAESGDVCVYRQNRKTLRSGRPFFHAKCTHSLRDPKTHLVYFPLENLDEHPVLRIMEPVSASM